MGVYTAEYVVFTDYLISGQYLSYFMNDYDCFRVNLTLESHQSSMHSLEENS